MGELRKTTSKRIYPVLAATSLLVLTACGKALETIKISDSIRDDIIKQGGVSLKEVVCPENIKPEAGQTFECVGILDFDGVFSIPVTQQDDQGTVRWTVPSVKGLLNVSELQTTIQQGLQKELGQTRIDCGPNIYRAAKPGDSFECRVLKRSKPQISTSTNKTAAKSVSLPKAKPNSKQPGLKNQPGIILITIAPTGDVNWQQVFADADAKTRISSTAAKSGANAQKLPAAKRSN